MEFHPTDTIDLYVFANGMLNDSNKNVSIEFIDSSVRCGLKRAKEPFNKIIANVSYDSLGLTGKVMCEPIINDTEDSAQTSYEIDNCYFGNMILHTTMENVQDIVNCDLQEGITEPFDYLSNAIKAIIGVFCSIIVLILLYYFIKFLIFRTSKG